MPEVICFFSTDTILDQLCADIFVRDGCEADIEVYATIPMDAERVIVFEETLLDVLSDLAYSVGWINAALEEVSCVFLFLQVELKLLPVFKISCF